MKTIKFLTFILLIVLTACNNVDFKQKPVVEILYSPVRLNDSAVIVMKKGIVDNIKVDSMRIGDTLSIQVLLYDLSYNLTTVRFAVAGDTSTIAYLPSDFKDGVKTFDRNTKKEAIKFQYIAKKSSKIGSLTIYLESENPDKMFSTDSLKLNSPVKFL